MIRLSHFSVLAICCGVLFSSACASRKPNVKPIDTTLDVKSSSGDQSLGINKDGDAIIQEERALISELQTVRHVNENLRMNVRTEVFYLKDCWKKRASRTSGEMPDFTEFDDTAVIEGTEEVGLVGDEVKVVRREDAVARLRAEQRRQTHLRTQLANSKKLREKCDFEAQRDQ